MSSGDIEGKARGWDDVWAALRECNLPDIQGITGIQQALAWIEILRRTSMLGPAFPALRDWFAGQALNGLCASKWWNSSRLPGEAFAAAWAYQAADAMLAERAKVPQ